VRPTFVPDIANDPGDAEDVYKLRLQVWDGVFWSTPDEMTVKAGDGNLPPTADARANPVSTVGETVWLDGSYSDDGDGSPAIDAYKWSFVATPDGFFGGLNNDAIVNPSFAPTVDGTYEIQLEVWDGEFWSVPDEVEITVGAGNQPPTAVIKGDDVVCNADTSDSRFTCNVDERAPVITLDGSDSVDEDPETLLFEWAFTSKPAGSNAAFNDPTLANPSFVPDAIDPLITEDYVIRLRVWDGEFWSDSVAISIDVTTDPNGRPTAVASFVPANPTANTVCVDATSDAVVGQTVQLLGNASTDPDPDPLVFEWSLQELPTGSLAALNDATVEDPSITPDVNTDTDTDEHYTLRLRVSDGALWSAPTTVMFTAGCGNTAPVADAGDDLVDETQLPNPGPDNNSVPLGTVQLEGCNSYDPDDEDQILFYQWQFYELPEASDAVLNNTGVCNPSFEADEVGFYSLRLQVDDGDLASGWDYVTIEAQ